MPKESGIKLLRRERTKNRKRLHRMGDIKQWKRKLSEGHKAESLSPVLPAPAERPIFSIFSGSAAGSGQLQHNCNNIFLFPKKVDNFSAWQPEMLPIWGNMATVRQMAYASYITTACPQPRQLKTKIQPKTKRRLTTACPLPRQTKAKKYSLHNLKRTQPKAEKRTQPKAENHNLYNLKRIQVKTKKRTHHLG